MAKPVGSACFLLSSGSYPALSGCNEMQHGAGSVAIAHGTVWGNRYAVEPLHYTLREIAKSGSYAAYFFKTAVRLSLAAIRRRFPWRSFVRI